MTAEQHYGLEYQILSEPSPRMNYSLKNMIGKGGKIFDLSIPSKSEALAIDRFLPAKGGECIKMKSDHRGPNEWRFIIGLFQPSHIDRLEKGLDMILSGQGMRRKEFIPMRTQFLSGQINKEAHAYLDEHFRNYCVIREYSGFRAQRSYVKGVSCNDAGIVHLTMLKMLMSS
jgi:hypothetical protein